MKIFWKPPSEVGKLSELAQGERTMDPELGVVDFFDSREGKRYGFLKVVNTLFPLVYTGERVFFHYDLGLPIIAGTGDFKPMFYAGQLLGEPGSGLRNPRKGDILIFEPAFGAPLNKADPWGYYSQWVLAERELLARRAIKVGTLWNGGWDDYLVDPKFVREMTAEEIEYHSEGHGGYYSPTFQTEDRATWLRGYFLQSEPNLAKFMISETECVRVVRHLDGGD